MQKAFLLASHTLSENLRGSAMRTIRIYIKKQDKRKLVCRIISTLTSLSPDIE